MSSPTLTYSGRSSGLPNVSACPLNNSRTLTYAPSLHPVLFGLNAEYCIDAGVVILTEPEAGGIFTGDGVGFFESEFESFWYFDPSVGLGDHVITWTKCDRTEVAVVYVNPLPLVTISPAEISIDPTAVPFYTMTGGDPSGGIYYVDGIETTILDTNAIAKGSHTVVYFYTDGHGCGSSATQIITIEDVIEPPPVEEPNYIDVICPTYAMNTVAYTTGDNGDVLLADVYIENCNVNTCRPVFIACHPAAATRKHINPVTWATDMCIRGWIGISPDFGHEVQGVQFTNAQQKKCVANVSALIRDIKANPMKYGGANPNNIILWGKSAGGVIAASQPVAANDLDANQLLPDPTLGDWWYPVNQENPSFSSVPLASGSESGAINSAIDNFIDALDHEHHFYNGTLDCTVPYSSTCGHGPGALENYNAQIALGIASQFIPFDGYAHDIGDFHSQILLGGAQRVVGVADLVYANNTFTPDIGIVAKFAALLSPCATEGIGVWIIETDFQVQ